MSHFFTAVIIPEAQATSEDAIEKAVEAVLAPYDENIQVPEYQKQCWCIGMAAQIRAGEHARTVAGTIETLRASFDPTRKKFLAEHGVTDAWDLNAADDEAFDTLWKAHLAPYNAAEAEALAADPDRTAPDPTCHDCEGTGKETTTYNPRSKWDYFTIGGRWDGAITDTERPTDDNFPYGDSHHTLPPNVTSVAEIIDALKAGNIDRCPRALALPEGVWLERGRMGWFGMSSGDKSRIEWAAEVINALECCPNSVAVGVDCHI